MAATSAVWSEALIAAMTLRGATRAATRGEVHACGHALGEGGSAHSYQTRSTEIERRASLLA